MAARPTWSMRRSVNTRSTSACRELDRLFSELHMPISLALNAQFPEQQPAVWKTLRASVPNATIIAHGLNNSTDLLPLSKGPEAQRAYIRQTIDMILKSTGVRSIGWSSPSVYPDAATYAATAAEGIRYSLDGMDFRRAVPAWYNTAAGAGALSADGGRHGPGPVPHQGGVGSGASLDRVCRRARPRSVGGSRSGGDSGRHRVASVRGRHAERCGGDATRVGGVAADGPGSATELEAAPKAAGEKF